MLGFIGLGQCGSNLAELAEKSYDYRSLAINTAKEDLETIEVSSKLKIGNSSGSAKDRNIAKNAVRENYKEILNNIINKFPPDSEKEKILFVCFSTGGGTGSGMSSMLIELMKKVYPNKIIIGVAILPTNDESPSVQYNCIECLTELFKLDIPVILIDNEKVKNEYGKISKVKLFNKINNEFLSNVNEFFIERNLTKYGTIDETEVLKLFSTPGVLTFATTDDIKDEKKVLQNLFEGFSYNIYADLAVDKKIDKIGLIYEISEKAMKNLDIDYLYKELGTPRLVLDGYYKPESNDFQKVVICTAGTVLPKERIDICKNLLNTAKKEIQKEVSIDIDLSDVSWIKGGTSNAKGIKINKEDNALEAILGKY